MPELPEVETVKSYVEKRILNKKISNIRVLNTKLRWPINAKDLKNVIGNLIVNISRKGKYILIKLDTADRVIVIHLGMTGVISFKHIDEYIENKHDHLLIFFDESVFIYNDVRKFGSIHITQKINTMFLLKDLGPEPLSDKFDDQYLFEISRNRSCSIKELIMNQKIVVGIGNIYASEALFLSKIHPAKISREITRVQYKKLIKNIKITLKKAIKLGGSTIKDFKNAEGKPGYFTHELLIYQKKHCPIHKRNLVKNIRISGRSSFYCDKCQKM